MSVRSRTSSYTSLENTNNEPQVNLDPAWKLRGASPVNAAHPPLLPVFSKFTGINNSPPSTLPSFQPVVSREEAATRAFYSGKPTILINPYKKLNNNKNNKNQREILLKPKTYKNRKTRKARKTRRS